MSGMWATAPTKQAEAGWWVAEMLSGRHSEDIFRNHISLLFPTQTHFFQALHLGKQNTFGSHILFKGPKDPGRYIGLSADVLLLRMPPPNALGGACCTGGVPGPRSPLGSSDLEGIPTPNGWPGQVERPVRVTGLQGGGPSMPAKVLVSHLVLITPSGCRTLDKSLMSSGPPSPCY